MSRARIGEDASLGEEGVRSGADALDTSCVSHERHPRMFVRCRRSDEIRAEQKGSMAIDLEGIAERAYHDLSCAQKWRPRLGNGRVSFCGNECGISG